MSDNTGQVVRNTTVYKLGWGQLNDGANVNSILHFSNLQLDIVGFLAILGEGSVLASSSVATLSKVIFLPRLLPAPQALLRPSRPDRLPYVKGWASGVHSGNDRDYINFIGHNLANADRLPDYSVKCIEIRRIARENTKKKNKALQRDDPDAVITDPVIKAKIFGPTAFVAFLGCAISLFLFAFSIQQQDGMGMLADICLSSLSTLIGVGNKWKLNLVERKSTGKVTPKGDVVIRYPKGSFVVIQCTEDVARELFFAPENIEYLVERPWVYRMIALVGTIVLMFGVIFLGNAGTNVQVAYAASFMVLNAGYWIVAALPQTYHWDTRRFEVVTLAFQGGDKYLKDAKVTAKRKPHVSYNETYTQALWKVIVATQDIEWVKRSRTAPLTDVWEKWLEEALKHANSMSLVEQSHGSADVATYQVPDWDSQGALIRLLERAKDSEKNSTSAPTLPEAPDAPAGVVNGNNEGASSSISTSVPTFSEAPDATAGAVKRKKEGASSSIEMEEVIIGPC